MPLATTWPLAMPICTRSARPALALIWGIASWIASAAWTARRESSLCATGAPKTAMTLSPNMLVNRAAVVANDGIGPVNELAEDGVQFFRIQFRGELCIA